MYDHNTEPRNTIQYNTKENKNKKISLSKGRIEQINEKKNLILKNKNTFLTFCYFPFFRLHFFSFDDQIQFGLYYFLY